MLDEIDSFMEVETVDDTRATVKHAYLGFVPDDHDVDLADPEAGGTGHTIRVCRQHGIPVAFQDSWMKWFAA